MKFDFFSTGLLLLVFSLISLVHCTFVPKYDNGVLTMPIQRWVNSERPFSAQPAKDRWCSRPHLQCANNSIVKTTNNLPLTNVYNVMYTGAISVGTPPQTFNVLFETSTGNVLVPSSKSPAAANLVHVYNSSKSSTYQADGKPVNISKLSFKASGFVSYDHLNINGIPVFGQSIIELTSLTSPFLSLGGIVVDGIVGMGYVLSSRIQSLPPFLNMMMQGVVAEPVFSFYFNVNPNSGTSGGQLTLGGIDSTKYVGSITYTDSLPVGGLFYVYWIIKADSFIVGPYCNGTKFCPNGCNMILDTGSTLILGPSGILSAMAALYGGVYNSNYQRYQVNCNTLTSLPNVTFTIAGTPFTLTPAQYVAIYTLPTGPLCLTNFSPFDLADPGTGILQWVVGDAFLSYFYMIYDFGNNRVGLAQTNQTGPFTPGGKK